MGKILIHRETNLPCGHGSHLVKLNLGFTVQSPVSTSKQVLSTGPSVHLAQVQLMEMTHMNLKLVG